MSELDVGFYLGLVLGLPIGITSSLIAWGVLFHVLVPKVVFRPLISKIPHEDREGYRYRVLIENVGRRRTIDVEVMCRLEIQGLHSSTPTIWKQVNLTIAGARIPDIPIRKSRIVRILPEKTSEFNSKFYPDEIREKFQAGTLKLEDLFSLGNDAKLVVHVFGYDEFSGSRKMFSSPEYRQKHIFQGKWSKLPAWWKR